MMEVLWEVGWARTRVGEMEKEKGEKEERRGIRRDGQRYRRVI